MGLLNDIYDSADELMTAREQRKKGESKAKALAKAKLKIAAKKQASERKR